MASAPAAAAASTTCERAKTSSSPSIVLGTPSCAVRSSAPKRSAGTNASAPAIAGASRMPLRGFEQRDDRPVREGARQLFDVQRMLGLGQHRAVDAPERADAFEILGEPRAARGVHAHEARDGSIGRRREKRGDRAARVRLARGFDAVFEVEHDGVGAGGEGLGEAVGAAAGDEENRAEQSDHRRRYFGVPFFASAR